MPVDFLVASVPCIISSLWAVHDISAAFLMEQFYHNHLSSRMKFVEALHKAQLWVRGLKIGEAAAYVEESFLQHTGGEKDKEELFNLMLYYRYMAEEDSTQCPLMHPYYQTAFRVNGCKVVHSFP